MLTEMDVNCQPTTQDLDVVVQMNIYSTMFAESAQLVTHLTVLEPIVLSAPSVRLVAFETSLETV